MPIRKVVSGGQTGADRAALDAALALGLKVGGWVPKGRLDETEHRIPDRYPNLREAETDDPALRTELNVRDSDATLILSHGELVGGSRLTEQKADERGKPCRHIDLCEKSEHTAVTEIVAWLGEIDPGVLNVAGPRASEDSEIYDAAKRVMAEVLTASVVSTPLNDQSLQIILHLRESVLAQCGRWDQIRWQVPSWFCTLSTISIGLAGLHGNAGNTRMTRPFFFTLGSFGAISWLLLRNLVVYEKRVIRDFNDVLRDFSSEVRFIDVLGKALKIERPFSFEWRKRDKPAVKKTSFWRTAISWFRSFSEWRRDRKRLDPKRTTVWGTATFWFLCYTALLTILCFLLAFGPTARMLTR